MTSAQHLIFFRQCSLLPHGGVAKPTVCCCSLESLGRLLPEWLNVAAYPDSVHSVLQQMPAANLNVLRLLLELCSFINTQSAVNEMDALALAEVLAPCMAWRPAPKPQPAPGGSMGDPLLRWHRCWYGFGLWLCT